MRDSGRQGDRGATSTVAERAVITSCQTHPGVRAPSDNFGNLSTPSPSLYQVTRRPSADILGAMQAGTITELSPQDGLGWITLDDGARVRFGATSCKGFVPSLGTRVGVVGTAPGFRGVIKATEVVPLPKNAAARTAPSRANLAKLDAMKVPFDDVLRSIVGRADTDDAFFADLERAKFVVRPGRAAEIECVADGFSVVAMDGGGNAFGVYLSDSMPGTPWVYWDHEIDTLAYVAPDTLAFFAGLLAERQGSLKDPAPLERVRSVLTELGVALATVYGAETFLEGQPVKWLPRGPLRR